MAASKSPKLVKLSIAVCKVSKGNVTGVETGNDKQFKVMLNPSSYTNSKSISYSGTSDKSGKRKGKAPLGASAASPQFDHTGSEKISFEVILDGTGVVEGKYPEVKDQIKKLGDIVYTYKGGTHEPNIVRIMWGSMSFDGRLTSMSTKYTLFKSSGDPLRATVTLEFTSYVSVQEEAKKANKTSPDLTHMIEVKAGDSLPLLCYRIYRDSAYYLEVAKHNGITNFRNIKPGTRLNFPPLR